MTVESPYGPNVIRLTDDASAILTKGGFIELAGTTEKEIYLYSDSSGIEALGFYDNYQPRVDSEYLYQLVPHGLSTLNKIKMGDSHSLTYNDAYRLIGEYMPENMDWIAPRLNQSSTRFHKHDLRIAADPDALVQRINTARESRIVKNRIDDYLAYISADNIYTGRNYMLGYGTHSAFTDNRIIAGFGTMNVFLGGDEPSPGLRRILLGVSTPELGHFAFLKCPTYRIPETGEFFYDCSDPDPDMLEIEGDFLSVERSLEVSSSLNVHGEIKLLEPSPLVIKNNQGKFDFRHEGVYIKTPLGNSLFAIDYTRLQMSFNQALENRDLFMIVTGGLGSNTVSIISMRYPDRYVYVNTADNNKLELRKFIDTPGFHERTSFIWHSGGGLLNIVNGSSFEMAYSEHAGTYLCRQEDDSLAAQKQLEFDGNEADFRSAATFVVTLFDQPVENPRIETTDTMHYVRQKTTIDKNLVLVTSPIINSSLHVTRDVLASTLKDTDSDIHQMDPDGYSSINRATVRENLKVKQKLDAREIHKLQKIDVAGSFKASGTITSNIFIDSSNNQFFINPGPLDGEDATRLNELHLAGDFFVENNLSIGTDFITTSDFSSSKDLVLKGDYFETKGIIYADRFIDSDSAGRYTILSRETVLQNLNLTDNFTGDDIDSTGLSGLFHIKEKLTARDITSSETSSFRIWHTTQDSVYITDPSSHTIWHTLYTKGLQADHLQIRDSAQFLYPATVSETVTIGKTLTMRDSFLLKGEFSTVRTTDSTQVFSISTDGAVIARGVQLQDTFTVDGDGSTVYLEDGMDQQGRNGNNLFRNTTIYSETNFYDSSLEVADGKFFITTEGNIDSEGQLTVSQSLLAGSSSIASTLYISGSSLVFDSITTESNFFNFIHSAPMNISAGTVRVESSIFSDNVLISPIIYALDAPADYHLDPHSNSRLRSLDIITKDGSGGGLILSGPLHFSSMQDHDDLTLSLDPSADTTLTRLIIRQSRLPKGINIHAIDDQAVLLVYAADGSPQHLLFKLDNNTFSMSAGGEIISSGTLTVTGQPFRIESAEGLIFSTSSHSMPLSSENLFYLVGQKYRAANDPVYADHLHQHSEISGIPVTDIARRDIDNIFSARNTFTASAWSLFLRPQQNSSAILLQQKDENDVSTIRLFGDGVLEAVSFQGDGTYLTDIDGGIIANNSITAHDFKTASLDGSTLAENAVTTEKMKRDIISTAHIKTNAVTSGTIASSVFNAGHFIADGLLNEDFAESAFKSRHLARKSITGDKITAGTLQADRIQTQAIIESQIIDNNITADKIISDQIRSYHIQADSIHGYHFQATTLITADLAPDAVGTSEIATEAVTSGIVLDENITRTKIADYTLTNAQFSDHTLIDRVLHPAAITLEKITSSSLSSRDILDYTLQNEDFQYAAITTAKLADESIKRRHFANNSLDSLQLQNDSIATRHFATRTILSDEILNLSLANTVFRSHTINPSHIETESITDDHLADNAINRDKIGSGGISITRFQPFALSTSQISASAVTEGNLQVESILNEHIIDATIITEDIKDDGVSAVKIKDYSLLGENIDDYSLDTDNILNDAIHTEHLAAGAVHSVDIATNTLTTGKFADFNINSRHIRDENLDGGGLRTINFAENAAVAGHFHTDSINTGKVESWSLHASNFAADVVTAGKLTDDSLIERLFVNEAEFPGLGIGSIDVGQSEILSSAIALLAVTEEKILTDSLLSRNFGPEIISAAKINPLTLITASFADSSVRTLNIADSQIDSRIVSDRGILHFNIADEQISARAIAPLTISSVSIALYTLTSRLLQEEQITEDKIQDKSIDTRVLADRGISGSLIANYSITTDRIKPESIESEHIVSGAITASKLGEGIVTSEAVIDGSIIDTKLSSGFASARILKNDSITTDKIRTSTLLGDNFHATTISTAKFQNSAFYDYHFQDSQFTSGKIASGLPVSLFRSNSISGNMLLDGSITEEGPKPYSFYGESLQNNTISHAKIMAATISEWHFADSTLLTADFLDGAVENHHIVDDAIEAHHIKERSLSALDIMTRSLPGEKFVSGSVRERAVTDAAITTDKIAEYAISGRSFASGVIDGSKLSDHFLTGKLLQEKSLDNRHLQNDSILSSHFATNFFFGAESISSGTFTSSHIALQTLNPLHFADNEIGAGKFDALPGHKFRKSSIDTAQIAPGSITGEKIVTETLGDFDHGLIFLREDNIMSKVYQRTATESDWDKDVSTGFAVMSMEPDSSSRFAFTSNMGLYRANTGDGTIELLRDFSAWEDLGNAGWNARNQLNSIDFDGKIWVMGGSDGTNRKNDVWYFDDTTEVWTEATAAAGWDPRSQHTALVFSEPVGGTEALWVLGGTEDTSTGMNDVWYSSDGISWTQTGADEHTVLLMNAEYPGAGSIRDYSPYQHGFTNNSVGISADSGIGTKSMEFNGNAWLDITDYNEATLGAGEFTIEFMLKTNVTPGFNTRVLSFGNTDSSDAMDIVLEQGTGRIGGAWSGMWKIGASLATTTSVTDNQWHHIALVRDSTNQIRLFINGSLAHEVNDSTSFGASGLRIGARIHDDIRPYTGLLDELRISKTARYTTDFTPPTNPHPNAWPGRKAHAAAVFDNKMWIFGGSDSDYKNDIWSSADGAFWTYQGDAAWAARQFHQVISFNGKLWLLAGSKSNAAIDFTNEIWSSADGINWTQEAVPPWIARDRHTVAVYRDKLWVMGGRDGSNNSLRDVWFTEDGTNWTEYQTADWTKRRAFAAATLNNKMYVMGGFDQDSNLVNDLWAFEYFTALKQMHWEQNELYNIVLQNDAETAMYSYDHSVNSLTKEHTDLLIYVNHLLDGANDHYVGISPQNKLFYSDDISFTTSTAIAADFDFQKAVISPAKDYVYAIREISTNEQRLLKIPWDGADTFEPPVDLTGNFAGESPQIKDFTLTPDGRDIYLIADMSGSMEVHRISTSGSGLTTIEIAAGKTPAGGIMSLGGEVFNPFIPFENITNDKIVDRSIDGKSLQDEVLVTDHFTGVDGSNIQSHMLDNYHFADDAFTYSKWQTETITGYHLDDDIFDSVHIADGSLSENMIPDYELSARVFKDNTFSTAHIIAETLDLRALSPETFERTHIAASDLQADKIATGSLLGAHFSNLTSASIADNSLDSEKYQTRIFAAENFRDGVIYPEKIALNSITADRFQTNQFDGGLITDDAINADFIETGALLSGSIADQAVLNTNIAADNILSRMFQTEIFTDTHMDSDVVSERTLAGSAITSDLIIENSFSSVHFTTDAVVTAAIANLTISSDLLQDAIFDSQHFAANSITEADKIADQTITVFELPFNSLLEDKLDFTVTSTNIRTAAFDARNTPNISGEKIAAAAIREYHFPENTIPDTKIKDGDITDSKLSPQSLIERHFATNSLNGDSFADNAITDQKITTATITWAKVQSATITDDKFAADNLENLKIHASTLTGAHLDPATLISDDKLSDIKYENFARDSIENTHLAGGEKLDETHIKDNSLTERLISQEPAGLLQTGDFAAESVSVGKIAAATLTGAKLAEQGFENGYFTADAFAGSNFSNGTIEGKRLSNDAIYTANLPEFTNSYFKAGIIGPTQINNEAFTSAKIIDNSFPGDRFTSGSITAARLATNAFDNDDFAAEAFTTGKISTSIDISGKVSTAANIAGIKVQNNAITGAHLSANINSDSYIASDSLTMGKLIADPQITSAKIANGIIEGSKIIENSLTETQFADGAFTKVSFDNTDTPAISDKIADDAVENAKLAANSITPAKIDGSTTLPGNRISAVAYADFAAGSFDSSSHIAENSITTAKVALNAIDDAAFLPDFSSAKLDPVTGREIVDGSFNNLHFADGFFTGDHIEGTFGNTRFADGAVTGTQIKNNSLNTEHFADRIISKELINPANKLTADQFAAGTLEIDNFARDSFTVAHFKDNAVKDAKINSGDWQGVFDGNTLDTSIHQHSPLYFRKTMPTGFTTLLYDGDLGRTTFAYKITDTPDSFPNAQSACYTDKALLCDTAQLLELRRNSALTANTYYTGDPAIVEASGDDDGGWSTNYLTIPKLKYEDAGSSLTPAEVSWDFYTQNDVLHPVLVSEEADTPIKDVFFDSENNYFFYIFDNKIYRANSSGMEAAVRTIEGDTVLQNARFVHNPENSTVSRRVCILGDNTKIQCYRPTEQDFLGGGGGHTITNVAFIDFFTDTDAAGEGVVGQHTIPHQIGMIKTDLNKETSKPPVLAFDSSTTLEQVAARKYFSGEALPWTAFALTYTPPQAPSWIEKLADSGESEARWSRRWGHNVLSFIDGEETPRLLLTGGYDNVALMDDIWSSTDGITWTQHAAGTFGKRRGHSVVKHESDGLFLTAGMTDDLLKTNDLWQSADDGVTWTEIPVLKNDADTKLLINSNSAHDSTVVNDLTETYTLTNTSVSHKNTERKFGRSSLYFNGSSYLTLSPSNTLDVSGDNMTIEFWMYLSDNSTDRPIIEHYDSTYYHWYLRLTTDKKFHLYLYNYYGVGKTWDSATALNLAQWYHIALTKRKSGSNRIYTLFINGESQGDWTTTYNTVKRSYTYIGCAQVGYIWRYFNGYIDELSISTVRRYTANFTPPDRFTPRYSQQMLSYDGKMFVFGGEDSTGTLNDVWSSSDSGKTWEQLTAAASWAARTRHASVIFKDKMWLLGGQNGATYMKDAWNSTDGITWTRTVENWAPDERAAGSAVVFRDPGDGEEKMWLIAGQKQDTALLDFDTIINSTDGVTWNTFDIATSGWTARFFCPAVVFKDPDDFINKIWTFGGYDGANKNDVWALNYPDQGTILRNIAFTTIGQATPKEARALRPAKLTDQDEGLMFHCPEHRRCYIAKKTGNLIYANGNAETEYEPKFTITDDYGGEKFDDIKIVDIKSSTVAEAGAGNRYLYLLSENGKLFSLKITDAGAPDGSITLLAEPSFSGVTYEFNKARLHCRNNGNDEIYITGLKRHLLVYRQNQTAGYACCTPSLK
jgi:hypothetical protein